MHSVTDALLAALGHYFSFADEETEAPGEDGVQPVSEAAFPTNSPCFPCYPFLNLLSPAACLTQCIPQSRVSSPLSSPERDGSERVSHPLGSHC